MHLLSVTSQRMHLFSLTRQRMHLLSLTRKIKIESCMYMHQTFDQLASYFTKLQCGRHHWNDCTSYMTIKNINSVLHFQVIYHASSYVLIVSTKKNEN